MQSQSMRHVYLTFGTRRSCIIASALQCGNGKQEAMCRMSCAWVNVYRLCQAMTSEGVSEWSMTFSCTKSYTRASITMLINSNAIPSWSCARYS